MDTIPQPPSVPLQPLLGGDDDLATLMGVSRSFLAQRKRKLGFLNEVHAWIEAGDWLNGKLSNRHEWTEYLNRIAQSRQERTCVGCPRRFDAGYQSVGKIHRGES